MNIYNTLYIIAPNWKKQILLYNVKLLSIAKEETIDTPTNMDESQKHCVVQKNPDTKEYILCDYFHL